MTLSFSCEVGEHDNCLRPSCSCYCGHKKRAERHARADELLARPLSAPEPARPSPRIEPVKRRRAKRAPSTSLRATRLDETGAAVGPTVEIPVADAVLDPPGFSSAEVLAILNAAPGTCPACSHPIAAHDGGVCTRTLNELPSCRVCRAPIEALQRRKPSRIRKQGTRA